MATPGPVSPLACRSARPWAPPVCGRRDGDQGRGRGAVCKPPPLPAGTPQAPPVCSRRDGCQSRRRGTVCKPSRLPSDASLIPSFAAGEMAVRVGGEALSASPLPCRPARPWAPPRLRQGRRRPEQGERRCLQASSPAGRRAPGPLPFAAGEMTAKARDEAPFTAAPRRGRDGPLCSRSAVRGLGDLSVFSNQLSPAPLVPPAIKGTGHAHRQGAVLPRRPALDARPRGGKGPPQALFWRPCPVPPRSRWPARRPNPLQQAHPIAHPTTGPPVPKGAPAIFSSTAYFPLPLPILQKERPALRPASPTHWASILRWCPPGGRRVPWSPRRWRR